MIVGGALCPLIPHIAISCVPPFPVIPATYVFIGRCLSLLSSLRT